MPYNLVFQPSCGASGDMILGAMLDLTGGEQEFIAHFKDIGLKVAITVESVESEHLRCRQVVIATTADSPVRSHAQIRQFIRRTPFSQAVKEKAAQVFESIFCAEAAVHGQKLGKIHLHELGADDSLIDIIGFAFLWEKFDFCPILFTTLVTGRGSINTRHGILPVPAPAVLELIRGLAFNLGDLEAELLTPTGAAILAGCGRPLPDDYPLRLIKAGSGAGQRRFPGGRPNILRVMLAEPSGPPEQDRVAVLEFWVDDMTGETLAAFSDRIIRAGARDVFLAPGVMKKGRPGFSITVLAAATDRERMIQTIFNETSTIGLRIASAERVILARRTETIMVEGIEVCLKVSSFQDAPLHVKPEFADVLKLAEQKKISVNNAMKKIEGVIHEQHRPG